jgi:hypothetical protein
MNLDETVDSESRFVDFVEELVNVIGHADRARPTIPSGGRQSTIHSPDPEAR